MSFGISYEFSRHTSDTLKTEWLVNQGGSMVSRLSEQVGSHV